MGLQVRERYVWNQFRDEKLSGRSQRVPGHVHYVVPTTAYDAGFSIASAGNFARDYHRSVYDTFKLAHDACVDGRGDAIVLLPGLHNVATASIAMSKAGVSVWGPESWVGLQPHKPMAILTTNITGDEIANVTAPDVGFVGVNIRPITASDAMDLSADGDGFYMEDCYVDLFTPAVNAATVGLTLAAATDIRISRSKFVSDGAQGNAIVATGAIQSYIEDCLLYNTAGTWASAILCGAATTGLFILRNQILCYGTALTAGVNGTGASIASGVFCGWNGFGSLTTVPIDNFDAGECELAENYHYGVGGTDGGVLIVAIT